MRVQVQRQQSFNQNHIAHHNKHHRGEGALHRAGS